MTILKVKPGEEYCEMCAGTKEIFHIFDDLKRTAAVCEPCFDRFIDTDRTFIWWQVRGSYFFARLLLDLLNELRSLNEQAI